MSPRRNKIVIFIVIIAVAVLIGAASYFLYGLIRPVPNSIDITGILNFTTNYGFNNPEVTVLVENTEIRGFRIELGEYNSSRLYSGRGDAFLGIPYALQFNKTENLFSNALPYNFSVPQVIECLQYGDACMQPYNPTTMATLGVNVSHNCLTLNVIRPVVNNSNTLFDVLVYIHGGYLIAGTAAEQTPYSIVRSFTSRNIVYVSIQYRLGIWGFLMPPNSTLSANRGLRDALLALTWIKNNIRLFNGNPNAITILGHSAGGCIASALALSPLVLGNLFQKVIYSSSAIGVCSEHRTGYDYFQHAILYNALCPNATDAEQCLQQHDDATILQLTGKLVVGIEMTFGGKDNLLPGFWRNYFATSPNRPTLFLTEQAETSLIVAELGKKVIEQLNLTQFDSNTLHFILQGLIRDGVVTQNMIDRLLPHISDIYLASLEYISHTFTSDTWRDVLNEIFGDIFFLQHVIQQATELARINRTVYIVENTCMNIQYFQKTNWQSAIHGTFIVYLMPSFEFHLQSPYTQQALQTSNLFADIVVNFIKDSQPGDNSALMTQSNFEYQLTDGISLVNWTTGYRPHAREWKPEWWSSME